MSPGPGREQPAQGLPPADLTGFPTRRCAAGKELFRTHRGELGPWWFGSSGGGRFDLPAPRGTCYTAETALVAVREWLGPVLGGSPRVPESLLVGAVVTRLPLPLPVRAAALRSARAAAHGVLRELEVLVPYAVPQAWARAFDALGLDGVSYGARFTPGRAGALALFGAAGDGAFPVGESVSAGAVRGAPVAVQPPRLDELGVVPTPRTRPEPTGTRR